VVAVAAADNRRMKEPEGTAMVITTTARHMEVGSDVKEFAEKRLAKLERYAPDIREAHLILNAEKHRYTAEIILRLNRHEIVAREENSDVRTSIDRAADRLEHQIKKLKERRASHGKGEGRPGRPGANGQAGEAGPDEDAEWGEAGLAGGQGPE
jgi:putative sigma-54 modulation protein